MGMVTSDYFILCIPTLWLSPFHRTARSFKNHPVKWTRSRLRGLVPQPPLSRIQHVTSASTTARSGSGTAGDIDSWRNVTNGNATYVAVKSLALSKVFELWSWERFSLTSYPDLPSTAVKRLVQVFVLFREILFTMNWKHEQGCIAIAVECKCIPISLT